MRVLICTTSDLSTLLLKGQLSYLGGKGVDVHYATISTERSLQFAAEEGATLHNINFEREISPFMDIRALMQAIALLIRLKPDLVNAGTPKAGFIFMLASWLTGVGIRVFTLRGLRSGGLTGIKKKVVQLMEKYSIKLSEVTIAISPSLKKEVAEKFAVDHRKLIVLGKGSSNGVDTEHYDRKVVPKSEIKKIRSHLNYDKLDLLCCFVGRLTADKGVNELVSAVNSCAQNIGLILVGPIEEADPLDNKTLKIIESSENIQAVGFQDDIRNYIVASDILILYSYREGFGNVVVEAASMGVPALSSDIPGPRDSIVDKSTGWLIPPRDSTVLKKKIEEIATIRNTLPEYGQRAQQHVAENFSNHIVWESQLKLYKTLMEVNK